MCVQSSLMLIKDPKWFSFHCSKSTCNFNSLLLVCFWHFLALDLPMMCIRQAKNPQSYDLMAICVGLQTCKLSLGY